MGNYPNGIGIVKLMGRHSGFIASHSALSSGDVDLVIVPEVKVDLPLCFAHLHKRLLEKGHAVVVVSEGSLGEMVEGEEGEVDQSGNKVLPPVGVWLQKKMKSYFEEQSLPTTIKYIDPSYIIRSCPANSADSMYCAMLGQNAVHGALAGFSAVSVGLVNNRMVFIPMALIDQHSPRHMNPNGRTWERVLVSTSQVRTIFLLLKLFVIF